MKYKQLTPQAIRYLVVHASATPPEMDIGAKEIDLWHRQRGWFQIGYHAVIRRNGIVEQGRDITIPGAHARGWNEISLGICLVGGIDTLEDANPVANYTVEQMETLAEMLTHWKWLAEWNVERPAPVQILGHRDLGKDLPPSHFNRMSTSKACPCFDVIPWVEAGMPKDWLTRK